MMNKSFQPLNVNKLKVKNITFVSSKEALKDISPIDWSKDVLSGKKKVIIRSDK